jgi:nucleoside-diphosphate-sugar epimerase
MTKPVIAITGTTGFIGSHLLAYLQQRGFTVIPLGRNQAAHWDLTQAPVPGLLQGVDILIHTALDKSDTGTVNLQGSAALFAAAKKEGVKKIIFFSSTSAHEAALSFYGKSKLAIEALLDKETDVILKCGLVLGNSGLFKQLLDFTLQKKKVPLINGGKQPIQYIAIDNICAAVAGVIEKALSGTFVLCSAEAVPYRRFFETIADVWQEKLQYISLPGWLLKMVISVAAFLHIKIPVRKENLLGLQAMKAVNSTADLKTLDITILPLRDILEAIKQAD